MRKNKGKGDTLFLSACIGLTGIMGAYWLGRKSINKLSDSFLHRLMVDPYKDNLWEFVSASQKYGLQTIVETNLRTEKGKVIDRPLGSPKKFPNFNNIMFNFAQLHTLPTDESVFIDTEVIIGPSALKPLKIKMPIIIAPMAYGISLSKQAKIALAKGSSKAGTATSTGEGPLLLAERRAAHKLIIQYNRAKWNKSENILKMGDMIELYVGQGASGGIGHVIKSADLDYKVRKKMKVSKKEPAVIHSTLPGMNQPKFLKSLVRYLKELTSGVPVGAKIAAGKYLERDLDVLIDAEVDFITIDGCEAGTYGSPPILEDDFGLPLFWALCRASDYLKKKNVKDKVSLLASGGLKTPGDFLKAIALGADAVYIGGLALFAMTHTQVLKALPWEPPPEVVFYRGKKRKELNIKEGANNLYKFLYSCKEEMDEGIRALGKTALRQINREDLFALDALSAETAGIPLGNKEI